MASLIGIVDESPFQAFFHPARVHSYFEMPLLYSRIRNEETTIDTKGRIVKIIPTKRKILAVKVGLP